MNCYSPEFIVGTLQGFRKKPKKFCHYVRLERGLYDDLVEQKVFDIDYLITEGMAFLEVSADDFVVTISFITYWNVEDVHIRILSYLVRKAIGFDPIERGGVMF